jgi:hypothetical protein
MKLAKEDQLHVWCGGNKPNIFKHLVYHRIERDVLEWLHDNFKRGYGIDYYYRDGKIWFRNSRTELLFILRWA